MHGLCTRLRQGPTGVLYPTLDLEALDQLAREGGALTNKHFPRGLIIIYVQVPFNTSIFTCVVRSLRCRRKPGV